MSTDSVLLRVMFVFVVYLYCTIYFQGSLFCCSILAVGYLLKWNDDNDDDVVFVWKNLSFIIFQNMEAIRLFVDQQTSTNDIDGMDMSCLLSSQWQ